MNFGQGKVREFNFRLRVSTLRVPTVREKSEKKVKVREKSGSPKTLDDIKRFTF